MHSDVGASMACNTFQRLVENNDWRLSEITHQQFAREFEGIASNWCRQIRVEIENESTRLSVPIRQLACTFLGAIVFDDIAGFVQIGDGAIVIQKNGVSGVLEWPQSGEYANTTNFLTDDDFLSNLQCKVVIGQIEQLAMFSDGLERLILKFSERTVHQPFLTPLFTKLREVESGKQLTSPLEDFLVSQQVNQRTDDDKTLVLAVREI